MSVVQKDVFLAGEGDAWFARNTDAVKPNDPMLRILAPLLAPASQVLEIGCGDGWRMEELAKFGHKTYGVDPSVRAITTAAMRGVVAQVGTADCLDFPSNSMDAVIFGFCLSWCDDADLFRIAMEADRVLATRGWLAILDFQSEYVQYRPYSHFQGLMTRKMNYRAMFEWHPAYSLVAHEKFCWDSQRYRDDADQWVSVSILRKGEL